MGTPAESNDQREQPPVIEPNEQLFADLADRASQLESAALLGLRYGYEDLAIAVEDHGPKSPQYVLARQMFNTISTPIMQAMLRLGIDVPQASMELAWLAEQGRARKASTT